MPRIEMLEKGWENLNPVVWRRFDTTRIGRIDSLGRWELGLSYVGVG